MMPCDEVDAIAVVIPAHNEDALLAACLASVDAAAAHARDGGIHVEIIVALDSCVDESEAIAARAGVRTVTIAARNVGAARTAGTAEALALLDGIAPPRIWLAHTDADSVVPPNWLTHQHELARRGADVVVGTVRPDFRDLTAAQRRAWTRTHTPGVANGHVHGANLGIRADVFLAAGGFPAEPVHEDVHLVDAARRQGARIVASDGACVETSGRSVGRAPDGYARYLREDLIPLAEAAG